MKKDGREEEEAERRRRTGGEEADFKLRNSKAAVYSVYLSASSSFSSSSWLIPPASVLDLIPPNEMDGIIRPPHP
jgi:hypothetical protein